MEKLYNNILLQNDFGQSVSDAQNVPYLQNPPEVINVSVGRQLFVDDFLIEETTLTPAFHTAKKVEENPIFKPETAWETESSPVACPKSGGVWYDEEEKLFKMWYEAGWLHHLCYAVSADGFRWERPDLGIVGKTNIILPYTGYAPEKLRGDLTYLRPDSTSVCIDYTCPQSQRYKLFLRNPGGRAPGIVAVSRDGIHFENFAFTGEMDDRSTVFYNPFRKKWVYSIRSIGRSESEPDIWWRKRNYRECDDFLAGATWQPHEEYDWLACDALDLPHPYIGYTPQLYNVDCVGYESIMLGMFQILYGPENPVCEKYGIPKITELIPMYSRDGYHFSRPHRKSLIHASMYPGAWDRGYIQSTGGVTIIQGDTLRIYYTGFAGDATHKRESWTTNGMYCGGAVGLATLRRDGFVSMNGEGWLLSRKLQFFGKQSMFVNVQGKIYAEILDAAGNALDTSAVFCGDCTRAPLSFPNIKIADLNGRVLQIRFFLEGHLYSFGFADANGDFGGAHAAGIVQ